MGKALSKRVGEFLGACMLHLKRGIQRKESPRAALKQLRSEWRRLRRSSLRSRSPKGRRDAVALAKKGTQAYNQRDYLQAEMWFRKSLEDDPGYARAHTYLGNTLYKQDRPLEAAQAWQLAIRVEPDSDAAQEAQEKLMKIQQHRTQRLNDVIDDLQHR
jgi:tetratricopeptide (TPR) repeat protein